MKLDKTLVNLRKCKDSFFNFTNKKVFIDYDLFKNGIKTLIVRNDYENYVLYKKEFIHHRKFYGNDMPRTIIYYLKNRLYHHIPLNINSYFKNSDYNGSNFLLILK